MKVLHHFVAADGEYRIVNTEKPGEGSRLQYLVGSGFWSDTLTLTPALIDFISELLTAQAEANAPEDDSE